MLARLFEGALLFEAGAWLLVLAAVWGGLALLGYSFDAIRWVRERRAERRSREELRRRWLAESFSRRRGR